MTPSTHTQHIQHMLDGVIRIVRMSKWSYPPNESSDTDSTSLIPHLPEQTWDQYIGDLYGPEVIPSEITQQFDGLEVGYDSLQYTQTSIEHWATHHSPQQTTDLEISCEQEYVCYGTVSYLVFSL